MLGYTILLVVSFVLFLIFYPVVFMRKMSDDEKHGYRVGMIGAIAVAVTFWVISYFFNLFPIF